MSGFALEACRDLLHGRHEICGNGDLDVFGAQRRGDEHQGEGEGAEEGHGEGGEMVMASAFYTTGSAKGQGGGAAPVVAGVPPPVKL